MDAAAERRMLEAIATAAAQASSAESKIRRLQRLLERLREPVLVFTEYRDTLEHLERHLRQAHRPLVSLHGGIDRAERTRVQNRFNAGGAILLATDAAAEGLNLHHHCRLVVHFELPWRPARIAQRAGRVDRLGQRRRVREIGLIGAASAERLVLAPLAARAARARMAGESSGLLDSLNEMDVARLVQDHRAQPPDLSALREASPPPPRMDLRREAELEVDRLERVRDAMVRSPVRESRRRNIAAATVLTRWRTTRLTPAVHLLIRIAVADAAGQIEHDEGFAVLLTDGMEACGDLRSLLSVVRTELEIGSSAEADAIRRRASAALARVTELRRTGRVEVERRVRRMRELRSASQRLVQAGLFDGRPVRMPPTSRIGSEGLLPEDQDLGTSLGDDDLRVEISIAGLLDARKRRA
jgi:superfamily II DNA/RNA helicase